MHFTTAVRRHLTRVDLMCSLSAPDIMPQSADLAPLAALPNLHTLHLEGLQLQRLQARLLDRMHKCCHGCRACDLGEASVLAAASHVSMWDLGGHLPQRQSCICSLAQGAFCQLVNDSVTTEAAPQSRTHRC